MNDPLEEKSKDNILFGQLTLFGSTLKDRLVLAVKENYWVLHVYWVPWQIIVASVIRADKDKNQDPIQESLPPIITLEIKLKTLNIISCYLWKIMSGNDWYFLHDINSNHSFLVLIMTFSCVTLIAL